MNYLSFLPPPRAQVSVPLVDSSLQELLVEEAAVHVVLGTLKDDCSSYNPAGLEVPTGHHLRRAEEGGHEDDEGDTEYTVEPENVSGGIITFDHTYRSPSLDY